MFRLVKYLKSYKLQCVLGPLLKLTEAIFELIVPLIMAKIIDIGIKNGDINYVYKMGGILIALGISGLVIALTAQYFASQASQGFGTVVRNEMFSHIQKLSNSEIDKLGASSLITRITNDINQLQVCVAMTIRLFLRAPFLVVGAAIMAISVDFRLSIIFIITIPIIAIFLYLIMSRSIPFFKKIQKRLDRISLITRENLSGVRVIRAFSRQKAEIEKFSDVNEDWKNISISAGRISALLNPLTSVVINIAIISILWFGGKNVYEGSISQGEIIALVNYMTQILLALIVVSNLVIIYIKSAASATRVNEVFDSKPSLTETTKDEISENINAPIIEFKDVFFSYCDSDEYSLSNITFEIKKGETIGVIGGTGSGKSTIVNLMPRFYEVSKGEILINGRNVKDYSFKQLRGKFGIVPQKAVLFSGTIRENMKWSKEDATDNQILKALEIAQARDFVEILDEGLDKEIVQKGKNLSGGQRQRLTIARALVSQPEILILDDSASALDYATDANLRKAISSSTNDMTVIIVSQRATSIKNADKIIVMDEGKIVGIGKHTELIEFCEIYREICLSQLSGSEILI